MANQPVETMESEPTPQPTSELEETRPSEWVPYVWCSVYLASVLLFRLVRGSFWWRREALPATILTHAVALCYLFFTTRWVARWAERYGTRLVLEERKKEHWIAFGLTLIALQAYEMIRVGIHQPPAQDLIMVALSGSLAYAYLFGAPLYVVVRIVVRRART